MFLKVRGVITKNILLLKYQKQAIKAALNRDDVLMLLPTALRKSQMYRLLPFIVSRDTSPTGKNTLDRKFYWSAIVSFIPDWESEIKN